MDKPVNFEVIIGTYEEFLLGYKIQVNDKNYEFKQSFATHEHASSLRCVATHGKYLASGGADDRICIYDMVARKEHITLNHHESTVNCLTFTIGNTHLISSSTDGTLAITRVGNWALEKVWPKSHKNGYPLAMAIHPTGKLLFTLGSDCTLNTWNLIKGRIAYIMNLKSKCVDAKSLSFIKINPNGDKFILGGGMYIEIWDIQIGGISSSFNYKTRVSCAAWLSDKTIVIGHENGTLTMLNIETNHANSFIGHDSRVKCMEYKNNYLITASSSGYVALWSSDKNTLTEKCKCNTGCRVTCITIVEGLKTKKEENEDNENEILIKLVKQIPVITKGKLIIEEYSDEEKKPHKLNQNNKTTKNKNKKNKKGDTDGSIKNEKLQKCTSNTQMSKAKSDIPKNDKKAKKRKAHRNIDETLNEITIEEPDFNCNNQLKNKKKRENNKSISTIEWIVE